MLEETVTLLPRTVHRASTDVRAGHPGAAVRVVVAAAVIDRLVHYAEVIALKGDSYRLRDRDPGRVPAVSEEP